MPVLFAVTTYETLGKNPWWAALDITRWQPVQAAHGDFEGNIGAADLETIVDAVAGKLAALSAPRDPSPDRWSEEVRAFLSGLADRRLTVRLNGAATQLHLGPPVRWDEPALGWLARALLQTDVAEVDDAGDTTYPLPRALDNLVPDDPATRRREAEEQALCARMQPLPAPPSAAVAVGSARLAVVNGGRTTPMMLHAENCPGLAAVPRIRRSRDAPLHLWAVISGSVPARLTLPTMRLKMRECGRSGQRWSLLRPSSACSAAGARTIRVNL